MSKNTSIALSDNNLEYVRRQVQSGRYGSVSEVVRDALRLAEERELKLEVLKRELQKGLDSGPARPMDWEAFIDRKFGAENGS